MLDADISRQHGHSCHTCPANAATAARPPTSANYLQAMGQFCTVASSLSLKRTLLTFRGAVVDLQHHERRDLDGCQRERPLLGFRQRHRSYFFHHAGILSDGFRRLLAWISTHPSCLRVVFWKVCCGGVVVLRVRAGLHV